MSPWDGLNRRKFPRVNYPCLVIVSQEQDKQSVILTHTENVGVGGVCVILKKNLKLFSPTEIELDLLDMGDHIKCAGKVVWSVRRKSGEKKKPLFYDIGIEFVDIPEADLKRVTNVVEKLVKQGKEIPYT